VLTTTRTINRTTGETMSTTGWIIIIVVVFLLLGGGFGYSRRGR